MDDRERIAAVFDPYYWTGDFTPGNSIERDCIDYLNEKRVSSLAKADAVLAALGDRLLPELPEGRVISRVFEIDRNLPGTRYGAVTYKPNPAGYWDAPRQGSGPTIPAAISDALEGK